MCNNKYAEHAYHAFGNCIAGPARLPQAEQEFDAGEKHQNVAR